MAETRWLRGAIAGSALCMALAGCSAIERQETGQTEQLLSAAGFEMKSADTPEKLAALERMHQHKFVRHDREGETTYVYADATDCKCLYTGNTQNYDEYEKLRVQENVASQEMMAAQMNQEDAMNWEMWGPW